MSAARILKILVIGALFALSFSPLSIDAEAIDGIQATVTEAMNARQSMFDRIED